MTFSAQHASKLPDTISEVVTNPNHLLNSVSHTALARASGWVEGGMLIDATLARFEAVVTANDNRAPTALAA